MRRVRAISQSRFSWVDSSVARAQATPFTGNFSLTVKPLIMTKQLGFDIDHEVMLGQNFLHYCLGEGQRVGPVPFVLPSVA